LTEVGFSGRVERLLGSTLNLLSTKKFFILSERLEDDGWLPLGNQKKDESFAAKIKNF
jgi:hypothetical protein